MNVLRATITSRSGLSKIAVSFSRLSWPLPILISSYSAMINTVIET